MSAQPASRKEITQLDRRRGGQSATTTVTPQGRASRKMLYQLSYPDSLHRRMLEFEDREPSPNNLWHNHIQRLITQCSVAHQAITTDSEILGGIPHIAGTRLSVGQVLGRLYVHGSMEKVVTYYSGQVNTEQIREAISYAQDFIEAVCEPPESDR